MGDTGPFSVGEKVLVPHTDKFYEAKVQKAQKRDDGLWYYFLHYLGWNKKWDEWVEETGLRRPAGASAAAAAAAAATPAAAMVAPGAAAAAIPTAGASSAGALAGSLAAGVAAAAAAGGGGSGSKKKRKAAGAASGDAAGAAAAAGGAGGAAAAAVESADPALQIELPLPLQKQLLDQYDAIHDDRKLLPLPRRPNVLQVFQQYVQYVREKQNGVSQAEEDLVAGLQVYFDKALYQCLLYKAERKQADQALAAGQVPSAIYGAEHLLRLVVKMPELLPQTGATLEALQLLVLRLEDLLTFMQVAAPRIFAPASEYVAAAPLLQRAAGGTATPAAASMTTMARKYMR